ncbi:MAG TPA: hypothetical protein PLE33_05880 [Candidatus Cloacimonas sp.]|nr:hypothetical protein [Candidatus Cloacimonas sp.]HPS60774.1 hypothetical protein [Candidatus Cloacimonas sp.]
MKIAIPSYRRPNVKTLELLKEFSKEEVFIFVHDAEDYAKYQINAGRAQIIQTNAPQGIVNQRNFILDYFPEGEKIIMLDDDIKKVKKLINKRLSSNVSVKQFFSFGFSLCTAHNYKLWGVYPIANSFFMKPKLSNHHFIIGTLTGIINNKLRYDSNLKVKEDYDFTLQNIIKFGGALRLDYYTIEAEHYTNKGGCVDYRNEQIERECANYLLRKYPKFLKRNPKRANEILIK